MGQGKDITGLDFVTSELAFPRQLLGKILRGYQPITA